jgi:hypothetical protein
MACHDNRKFSVNTFEYLPEPATLLLFGLGVVMLIRRGEWAGQATRKQEQTIVFEFFARFF